MEGVCWSHVWPSMLVTTIGLAIPDDRYERYAREWTGNLPEVVGFHCGRWKQLDRARPSSPGPWISVGERAPGKQRNTLRGAPPNQLGIGVWRDYKASADIGCTRRSCGREHRAGSHERPEVVRDVREGRDGCEGFGLSEKPLRPAGYESSKTTLNEPDGPAVDIGAPTLPQGDGHGGQVWELSHHLGGQSFVDALIEISGGHVRRGVDAE